MDPCRIEGGDEARIELGDACVGEQKCAVVDTKSFQ